MRQPREILLERHRATERKLNDARGRALAIVAARPALNSSHHKFSVFRSVFYEFVRPLRWQLAGMLCAWAVVFILNRDSSSSGAVQVTGNEADQTRMLVSTLRENRRQIAEFLDTVQTEPSLPAPPFVPKRRGEISSPNVLV